jgi:hypothetical protein
LLKALEEEQKTNATLAKIAEAVINYYGSGTCVVALGALAQLRSTPTPESKPGGSRHCGNRQTLI